MSKALELLEGRGLDVETCDRLGIVPDPQHGGDVVRIDFVRNGEIVRRKWRELQHRDDRRWRCWQDEGGVRCAFNEDVLRDDSLISQPVIITEGELDCAAAVQAGFIRTISVPDGAPPPGERSADDLADSPKYAWLREIMPLLTLQRAQTIILATDGDENGAALMNDLAMQLGRARCKFVVFPKARDSAARGRARLKDLNEALEDYGAAGVQACIEQAQFLKVDGVFRMSELPPPPPRTVWQIGFDLLGENFTMRTGDTTVVTGIPSFGKTTWVNDAVCRVVRRYGVNVAWASFEQEPTEDHKRNLRRWFMEKPVTQATAEEIARADAWIDARHRFLRPKEDEDVDLEWLIDKATAAVIQHNCRILVLDPWNEMDHSKAPHESTTEYVGRALRHLNRWRRAFGVHLLIVAHPTKSVKDPQTGEYRMPTLYDISDSAMFNNKADVGVIVHRSGREGLTTVKVAKSRYHDLIGKPGAVIMDFSVHDGHFRENERLS